MSKNSCPGKPGDLVVFKRDLGLYRYYHYAVNVGNGYIIHFTSLSEGTGSIDVAGSCCGSSNIAIVKREKYKDFAKPGDVVKVENDSWKGKHPLPEGEIVKRAREKLGQGGYSVLWNNCEHFARWCRYGEQASDQADGLMVAGGAAAVVGGAALAIGAYAAINSSSKKEQRKQ